MDPETARRRHAPILSQDNQETWFRIMRLYLGGESIDFAIQQTEAEYAYSTSEGCWNNKKRAKYKVASNQVMYELILCVNDTDQELFEELSSAKEIWEALRAKYSKISPQKAREDLQRLHNYKLDAHRSIEEAWAELRQIRRRIGVANPVILKATTDDDLLEYLLGGLPDEYSTTCTALEAQPSLQVEDKLLVLQNHQDQLRAVATSAFAAKSKTHCRRRKTKKICFLCGEGHWVRQCQVWKDLAKISHMAITNIAARPQESRSRSRHSRRPRSPRPKTKKDTTYREYWITDSESTASNDGSIAPTPIHSVRTKEEGKLYSGHKSRLQEDMTTSGSVAGASLRPVTRKRPIGASLRPTARRSKRWK